MIIPDLQNLSQLAMGGEAIPPELSKTLTAGTGFVGINLERPASLLLPTFAGLRNRVPVDSPTQGAATAQWRMQIGFGAYNFATNQGAAEAAVGGNTTPAAVTVAANYRYQPVRGDPTFQAVVQSKGYDDALAIETSIALSTLIKHDELNVLGGNSVALAAPVGTATPSTLVGTAAFAAGVWHFKVSAITEQGALTNATANSNVGEGVASAEFHNTAPGGGVQFFDISWPVVPGAVGYKVYCESTVAEGVWYLVAVTSLRYKTGNLTALGTAIVVPTGQTYITVNHCQVILPPANTQPIPIAVDQSANALIYDGLINWCEKPTMYGQALGTKIAYDADGAYLTAVGTGIAEIDYILQMLWKVWHTSPSLMVASSATVTHIGNILASMNTGSMWHLTFNQKEQGSMVGGLYIGGYTNKFASSMAGQQQNVDLWAHPYMDDGKILFLSENIPYAYARKGKAFGLDVQVPFTYFELGRVQVSFPFTIFDLQVLKCYHPLAQASISGIRVV
jgi:hypothetical protein